jgi:CheY-like chemotaxis protein
VIVPIRGDACVLAALTLASAEADRAYGAADLALAEELSQRMEVALQRARLYERERRVGLENARLYREAHEADRRKDEFIAMLSHELRNPLAPITTGLELLQMSAAERTDRGDEQILATLDRQVKTIVRLVDDLLDVSRITRGKIELTRERLDVGSVVEAAVESVRPRPSARPMHILLVDDNVDAAEGLRRILQLHGHAVSMAHDGPAALEAARASTPDLVLLDIGLPGMDGYEVVRRLRAEPELRRSYIAALSGYGQDQDRRRSRDAGFDAHLTKPVATEQLLSLLAEAAPRG